MQHKYTDPHKQAIANAALANVIEAEALKGRMEESVSIVRHGRTPSGAHPVRRTSDTGPVHRYVEGIGWTTS